MATPAKSVQCKHQDVLIEMYKNAAIPAFGIRQGGCLNFVYPTADMEDDPGSIDEGADLLKQFVSKLFKSESAAIYTLCLYKRVPAEGIDEATKCSLSWNFRLHDSSVGYAPGEEYRGGYAALAKEVADLKEQLKQKDEQGHKLGLIGEILEMEALQPIVMGLANKCADFITGPMKGVGELQRISGVPGAAAPVVPWREDPRIVKSLDTLGRLEKDLPAVLEKLAYLIESRPKTYFFYKPMLMKST